VRVMAILSFASLWLYARTGDMLCVASIHGDQSSLVLGDYSYEERSCVPHPYREQCYTVPRSWSGSVVAL